VKTQHPFLFAIFPILYLYMENTSEIKPTDLLIPICISLGATAVIMLVLSRRTKNAVKTALTTSYFLAFFYFYGSFLGFFYYYTSFTNSHLIPLWATLLVLGIIFIWRSRRKFTNLNKYLNITAILLVCLISANLGMYEIKKANAVEEYNISETLLAPENPRDIYYIIPDSYGSADCLSEIYDFDNSEFIDYLTGKGFYIASDSRSNYSKTTMSLPSSLNMSYFLPNWMDNSKRELQDNLAQLVANSEVSRLLKSVGYHYIYVSSGFLHDEMKPYAEVYKSRTVINNFTTYLCWNTALSPVMAKYAVDSQRNRILYSFDALANLPEYEEPIFVFAHIFCPHSPSIFDRNGNTLEIVEKWNDPPEQLRKTHAEQVEYTNTRLTEIVDAILAKSEQEPIIIIQGDHENGGTVIEPFVSGTNILNAYYLPDGGDALLYDSISPVNTFRVVFNYYFGADFKLLEDRSYCYNDENYPWEFSPVSECGRCP